MDKKDLQLYIFCMIFAKLLAFQRIKQLILQNPQHHR